MTHTIAGEKRRRKLEQKRSRNESADNQLHLHNKKKKKASPKRKEATDMIAYLGDLFKPTQCVRDPEEWKSPSYNFDRQVMSFVKWIYCKFNVPTFMFGIFNKKNKTYYNKSYSAKAYGQYQFKKETEFFFEWFMVIANGQSFARTMSDFFTKKEAHIFLNGRADLNIYDNYWRAKLIAAGASERLVSICLQRFPNTNHSITAADFWHEATRFLPRFENEIDRTNLLDVMDYITNSARENNNKFSFKGRTFSSLIKASNEWHKQQQLKKFGDLNYAFKPCPVNADWKWHDKQENCDWVVYQIPNSKELYREGKTMRHCVASYAGACRDGRSYIYSLMMVDGINAPERVLTIEVNSRLEVVQVRGRCNASPKGRADYVTNKWISRFNFGKSRYF